jgi:uncharacterized protein (TIGR03085 family)
VTAYAQRERRLLADLLLRLGPDQPTLCEGWTTRDLAAHLVMRDRRPDAAIGGLVPALNGYAERVRLRTAARPFPEIVHDVRRPPWWSPVSNPLLDEVTNTIEFFVHHEDARRGQPGWQPRDLDPGFESALWRAVRITGRLTLRRAGVAVKVRSEGYDSFTVGGNPTATLTGPPGELAVYLTGRKADARVTIEGDGLRDARLSL